MKTFTVEEAQEALKKLDQYLTELKIRWNDIKPQKVWYKIPNNFILSSISFLISILDELILFVEQIIPNGKDKKAAVLAVVSKLFNYMILDACPFWLKPFIYVVEFIVILIIDNLTDYIVEKYNYGFWKMELKNAK